MYLLFNQKYATEAYARDEAKKAEARGENKGQRIGTLSTLMSLVTDGVLSADEAAKRANMTVAEFEKESKKLSV